MFVREAPLDPETPPSCARCEKRECASGKDCFDAADRHLPLYEDDAVADLHRAATAIEARHYGKAPRLQEVIHFARERGVKKLGLAFCIGLTEEAGIIEEVLSRHFEVVSVCCKVSGIEKDSLSLERLRPDAARDVMCNPAGQAELLNRAGCEINLICGLCVGHDMIFTRFSDAPVSTIIVKDRVLAHNPAGALYCRYVRRNLE